MHCVALYVRHLVAIWAGGQSRFTPSYSQLTLQMVLRTALHCFANCFALTFLHCFADGIANFRLLCAYIFAHTPVPRVASNLHNSLCIVQSTVTKALHSALFTLHSVQCTNLCTVQSALCRVHYAEYTLCTMHSMRSAICSDKGSQRVGIGGFTRLLPCNYTHLLSIHTRVYQNLHLHLHYIYKEVIAPTYSPYTLLRAHCITLDNLQ